MEKIDFNKPTFEQLHPITAEGGTGTQKVWRFKNGFGASVVRFWISPASARFSAFSIGGSYGAEMGLWELAVIKFRGKNIKEFDLHYDNPVADGDVVGYLTEEKVIKLLQRISRITPPRKGRRCPFSVDGEGE